jgi:hypothetical protein
MKAKRALARIQGVSLPFLGVSWTPTRLDEDVARQVIAFLEDRRALYYPTAGEAPDYVVRSVIEIRGFLTDMIMQGGLAGELEGSLRSMRGACREFLDAVGAVEEPEGTWSPREGGLTAPGAVGFIRLNQALGKLRGVVGFHVAAIAATFGLDVEDDLASILPPPAE